MDFVTLGSWCVMRTWVQLELGKKIAVCLCVCGGGGGGGMLSAKLNHHSDDIQATKLPDIIIIIIISRINFTIQWNLSITDH